MFVAKEKVKCTNCGKVNEVDPGWNGNTKYKGCEMFLQ